MSTNDPESPRAKKPIRKEKVAKRSRKFTYKVGDRYPDSSFRHVPCIGFAKGFRGVPADMGWLWNLANRKGWRPGALSKSVKKWMKLRVLSGMTLQLKKKKASKKSVGKGGAGSKTVSGGGSASLKKSSGSDSCSDLFGGTGKNASGRKPGAKSTSRGSGFGSGDFDADAESAESSANEDGEDEKEGGDSGMKTALKVSKVKDIIYIVVHPLKELLELADGEDPFVDCEPIVFKLIQTPTTEAITRRMLREKKRYEQDVKKALEQALTNICQCAYEDVYCTDMNAIDTVIDNAPPLCSQQTCDCPPETYETDDSDWDIEYTPPFAMTGMKPKKAVMCHVETQWSDSDIQSSSKSKLKWKQSQSQSQTASNIKLKTI